MQNDADIKVSVICLTYNHEKYIRHTLEGFVNQKTNFKYEVLINDDASTDGTAKIIKEFEIKYPDIIKPVYQKVNQYSKGVKISREFLYPKAKGEYLAFCEGDDYWCSEDKLQKQYDALQSHPECSMCTCKVQCINEDGSRNERAIPALGWRVRGGCFSGIEMAQEMWSKYGTRYLFQTSGYFVRRDVMTNPKDEDLPYAKYMCGDQVMIRRALSKGGIYYIDEIMSCYRLFSIGSATSNGQKASREFRNISTKTEIRGDLLFDKYTEEKFHIPITVGLSNKLCVLGQDNVNMMREVLDEFGIREKEVMKKCSVKNRILFRLSRVSPTFFHFIVEKKLALERK